MACFCFTDSKHAMRAIKDFGLPLRNPSVGDVFVVCDDHSVSAYDYNDTFHHDWDCEKMHYGDRVTILHISNDRNKDAIVLWKGAVKRVRYWNCEHVVVKR